MRYFIGCKKHSVPEDAITIERVSGVKTKVFSHNGTMYGVDYDIKEYYESLPGELNTNLKRHHFDIDSSSICRENEKLIKNLDDYKNDYLKFMGYCFKSINKTLILYFLTAITCLVTTGVFFTSSLDSKNLLSIAGGTVILYIIMSLIMNVNCRTYIKKFSDTDGFNIYGENDIYKLSKEEVNALS